MVKYAPRYRLAFTLLNEDASSGNAAVTWDVEESLERESRFVLSEATLTAFLGYLRPTLDRFDVLHNFTMESQVQYHAPLAFTPVTLEGENGLVHGLTQEDLTVFVNSAEWTLCTL